ncbi:MAG: ATPase, T2SS/T4P/T4SS family [Phycisphaeraceae bacterium]
MPHLEIDHSGNLERLELDADQPKLTIGRHPDNRLCLTDDKVSRFHCEIERTDAGVTLRDLGSSNGTKLNDQPVRQATLAHGNTIRVGSTELRFVDADNADAIESTPARSPRRTQQQRKPATSTAAATAEPEHAIAIDDLATRPEDDHLSPVMTGRTDFGGSIEALTTVGQDVPYDASKLSLINGRGEVVHAADGDKSNTAQTIKVLRLLLLACIRTGASDVHLETGAKGKGVLVRLRVDGAMVEAATLPDDVGKRLLSLVKVLSDIDISRKTSVQEGHFSAQVPDRRVDYRVSFTPAMHGQKLVLRVLDPVSAPQKLKDLAMPGWMYRQIRDLSRQDTGMLLVCGPTGSGKTTTLYAVLRQIDATQRNIVSIEDPIEYEIPGVTQIPVDAQHGQDFNSLLRSVLRQDPDVIVLGEIRDKETATTAMQAATTGHLVLSTVHAKDTIGTVFRLLDLGVEPYLVASTLNLVLAQRLARQLCPECKQVKTPTPTQNMRLGRRVDGAGKIYAPAGCPRCFGTGYAGRRGIFELLATNDDIRDVIINSGGMGAMKKAVEMSMFTPLRDAGMQMVMQGDTGIDEIDRLVGIG